MGKLVPIREQSCVIAPDQSGGCDSDFPSALRCRDESAVFASERRQQHLDRARTISRSRNLWLFASLGPMRSVAPTSNQAMERTADRGALHL